MQVTIPPPLPFFVSLLVFLWARSLGEQARNLDRIARDREGQLVELEDLPTSASTEVVEARRYELEGTLVPARDALRAPLTEVPALWYRHQVVAQSWVRVPYRDHKGYTRHRLERREAVLDTRVEAAGTFLEDAEGSVAVDLGAAEPEARLVVDQARPWWAWSALKAAALTWLALMALAAGASSAGAVLGRESADLASRALFLLVFVAQATVGLAFMGALPGYFLWTLFAPHLDPTLRDRVWLLPAGCRALVVGDARPDLQGKGWVVSHDPSHGRPMVVTQELESARRQRLTDEVRSLTLQSQARATAARLLTLGAVGGVLAGLANLVR